MIGTMSNKLNWAINIGLLALIFGILFNSWVNDVFAAVFILATTAYFVLQAIRHRGSNKQSRFSWRVVPAWWLKFAGDDFEKPKKQSIGRPSRPK